MNPSDPELSYSGEARSNADDAELIRRMVDADETALGALYDHWGRSVYSLVLHLIRDPDEAEDVVEETLWQAWRQAPAYESSRGEVSTWLQTIGRRKALDRLQAKGNQPEDPAGLDHTFTDPVSGGPDFSRSMEDEELRSSAVMNRGRSAGIRSRLLMRARAEREGKSAPIPGPPDLSRGVASLTGLGHRATPGAQRVVGGESKRMTPAQATQPVDAVETPGRGIMWLAIAATVGLAATGVQLLRVTADRNAIRAKFAESDTLAPRADSLAAALNQKQAMITALTGADVRVIPLVIEGTQQQLGRMTWNRASNDWIVITHGLRQPKPGMTYQVWLATDNERISVGTFRPDRDGAAVIHATHALPPNALRAVTITEEPEGGVTIPTGPTVITGSG